MKQIVQTIFLLAMLIGSDVFAAQIVINLKITGALPSSVQIGGWGVTVQMPVTGVSIRTLSVVNRQLDASSFFASGVTPISNNLLGSFNFPDVTSNLPYCMLASLGNTGTPVGQVATLVFDLAVKLENFSDL